MDAQVAPADGAPRPNRHERRRIAAGHADSPLKDYFTKPQLAELLGVCVKTVERWAAMNEAPPKTRLGPRLIVFHRDDVKAWLDSRRGDVE